MPDVSRSDLPALLARLTQLLAEAHSIQQPVESSRPLPDRVLLTVEEAAAQLSIGRTLAYRLVSRGELASVRIGRLRRIPADAVREYARHLVAESQHSAAA